MPWVKTEQNCLNEQNRVYLVSHLSNNFLIVYTGCFLSKLNLNEFDDFCHSLSQCTCNRQDKNFYDNICPVRFCHGQFQFYLLVRIGPMSGLFEAVKKLKLGIVKFSTRMLVMLIENHLKKLIIISIYHNNETVFNILLHFY